MSKPIVVSSEDQTRNPFLRGILTRSLQECGLSFESSYKIATEIREALSGSVSLIVEAVRDTLDERPPELIADLMEQGVCLAGGGAQLAGLAERLSEETKMHCYVAEDSMTCVARRAGHVLEDLDRLEKVLASLDRTSTRSRYR